jgi:hypothetical protein
MMRVILLALFVAYVNATLDPQCESGTGGLSPGETIYMDYDQTGMSVGPSGNTILTVVFDVPTQYFYPNQTIGDKNFDRSVAITWHARNETNQTDELQGQCFTTKTAYEHCSAIQQTWNNADSPKDADGCTQTLIGELDFNALLNEGDADPTLITIQTESVDLYNVEESGPLAINHTTEQWVVYMIAIVETWNGFYEVADDAGVGDIDSHTPDGVDLGLDWDSHMVINEERYMQFMIPFKITFPKEITLDYREVTTVGRLVVLSAIIDQQIVNIDFTPDDGMFGEMLVRMTTQTQFPLGLNGFNEEGTTANASPSVELVMTPSNSTDALALAVEPSSLNPFKPNGD